MARRGFSLVELLVVIMIILIVVSLVLPALGGARDVARRSNTTSVMNTFSQAVQQFKQANDDRNPGTFTPFEMGAAENADVYGFTTMENVLLELSGGIVNSAPNGTDTFNFGPTAQAHNDNTANGRSVNPDLIGATVEGQNAYYSPPGKNLAHMTRPDQQFLGSGPANDADIPDLVDAWGQPFLLWAEDENSPSEIVDIDNFAQVDSDQGPARFYWASNAGYLKATNLGQKGRDQTDTVGGSLMGGGASDAIVQTTMAGVLGHPSFPNIPLDSAQMINVLPANSRSEMVMISAGADGIYYAADSRGAKSNDAAASGLRYGRNHLSSQNTRLLEDGKPVSRDVALDFDDILMPMGN